MSIPEEMRQGFEFSRFSIRLLVNRQGTRLSGHYAGGYEFGGGGGGSGLALTSSTYFNTSNHHDLVAYWAVITSIASSHDF